MVVIYYSTLTVYLCKLKLSAVFMSIAVYYLDWFQVSGGDATLLLAQGKAWMFIGVYVSDTRKKIQCCLVA